MTSYELRWYFWLRRELQAELGVPLPKGRPRALTRAQEEDIFRQIVAAPKDEREAIRERFIARTGVGYSTLQRVISDRIAAHGGRGLRSFRMQVPA